MMVLVKGDLRREVNSTDLYKISQLKAIGYKVAETINSEKATSKKKAKRVKIAEAIHNEKATPKKKAKRAKIK
jgi:Holliday junction resolvasome RuvABC DNA-binding subunit